MSILKDNHYKEKSQGVKHLYEIRKEFNIDTDIAIIGMACRFPGAKNYDEFGNNLLTGINSIKEIPPSRWDTRKYYSPHFDEPNKSMSKWCGLVDNIEQFDNQFFDISPDEARTMDPQQRLLLEETWHCIEDSGVALGILQRKNTSVFIGVMAVDYQQDALSPDVITDRYACLGNYECILANRLSHVFGFQGMSISIDAACASSLIAIHEARHSLIMRESDYALAGGVSLNLHPWKYISFSKSRMLSPDGQCKTFDIGANGYVPGDGVGVILLQRLDDAIIQNNHIYGVIKGSAANHTGRAISITAPRIEAQKKVILAAYKDAGISPETVNYMEADGTGTSLGDLIEVEALTKAFQEFTDKLRFCKLGSVKTNIGNLEGAAGIASVIKVLLMIQHRKIFKSLNIKKLNPIINFDDSPFDVATDISHWKSMGPDLPLRAGVSSFGFGGANSHILLQEFIESPKPPSKPEDNQLFFLSAKSSKSMEQLLTQWKHFVHSERFDTYNLRDMCTTLKLGRVSFPYRYGVHAHTKEELKKLITTAESSIQKHNRKYWCLRIGDFSFEGLAQFKNYLGRFDLFERHLKQIETCLCDLKIKKNGAHQLHQDTWDESVRPLYSFMVAYAGIRTLMDLGFKPDVITGEKAGVLVGNQSVLMKGINNDIHVMKKLVQELLRIRIRPYYIFNCKK
ncbi:MAG: beta-ketoacyl synthase N-terminal-like domain-containing protein, partial [bacterium]